MEVIEQTGSKMICLVVKQEGAAIKNAMIIRKLSNVLKDSNKLKKLLKTNFGSVTMHVMH
jgi:hypothetical protein